ncbi:MAG: hypothetical protein WDM81_13490 [Rhizomicrobium sp.]
MRIGILFALLLFAGAAQAQDVSWQTYTDTTRGFSMSYPPGWKVDPNFVDKGYRFHQGDTDDVRDGVAVTPGGDLAPGSTLQSDQLVLAVERARPADLCVAKGFLLDPPPDYFTQTLLDTPQAAQTVAEAGDLYSIEHIVVMASRTPCIAVQYTIVTARPQQGDAKPSKPFDRQALIGLLNHIAATVKPL